MTKSELLNAMRLTGGFRTPIPGYTVKDGKLKKKPRKQSVSARIAGRKNPKTTIRKGKRV